jgi:serine/threonine protein kinase/Flp pilus assembly protein TadD
MVAVTPPPAGPGLSRSAILPDEPVAIGLGTMPEIGETFLGFRLVGELGRGSFARVYLAEQEALAGRQVALKVTLRANREAERLARLQHANIVPVYSVHSAPPVQIICMPFLGRQTIADQLRLHRLVNSSPDPTRRRQSGSRKGSSTVTGTGSRAEARLISPDAGLTGTADARPQADPFVGDVPAVLRVLARLADGLTHAHARGVLHLDIKPANVLIADAGEPMLLDFNLSFDAREPGREMVGGTVPYMAPEQLIDFRSRGKGRIDHRTDLYSLGVVAYEMLTGFVPFPVSTRALLDFDGLIATRRGRLPSPCEVNPDVSPAVEAIVAKLLAPEADDRYQSAADLREDVERQLADRPLKFARERSLGERFGKWRRRNPRAVGRLVAAGLLAVAAALGGVAYWQATDRAMMVAAQQARQTRATLESLRLDLLSADDRRRPAAIARATELLDSHGLPGHPDWNERSAFRRLPETGRAELAGDLGELLLLLAHARWQGEKLKPEADRRAAAAELLRLNRAARDCFPPESPPPFLAHQFAELTAAAGEPAQPPAEVADRRPTARDQFLDAVAEIGEGKYHTAVPLLKRAVADQPGHAAAQFFLAYCRQQLGEHLAAIERYDVAASLMPHDPRPAFNRGISYARIPKRERKAEDEFTRAIELDPTDGEAYYQRAVIRCQLSKIPEAEADLNEALARNAPVIAARSLRGRVRAALGDKSGAAADLAAANASTPTGEMDYIARGFNRSWTDPDAALADFRAAAALNPRSLAALQNQAHILSEKKKDDAAALAVMNRVVELYREYAPARAGRAVLLARLGKRDEAHKEAEQARLLSDDWNVTYQAACVYALTSRTYPDDQKKALDLLARAFADGFRTVYKLDRDPDLAPIRSLPEFTRLAASMKNLTP